MKSAVFPSETGEQSTQGNSLNWTSVQHWLKWVTHLPQNKTVAQDRSLWHEAVTHFPLFLLNWTLAVCLTVVLCPPGDERLLLHRHRVLGSRPWGQTDGSLCGGALHCPAAGAGGAEAGRWQRGRGTQSEGLSSRQSPDSLLLQSFFLTHLLLPAASPAEHRWCRGVPWLPGSRWLCGVTGRCHCPWSRMVPSTD